MLNYNKFCVIKDTFQQCDTTELSDTFPFLSAVLTAKLVVWMKGNTE